MHNSFRFRNPSNKPRVSITYKDGGENHIIYFNDNGVGINKEHRASNI